MRKTIFQPSRAVNGYVSAIIILVCLYGITGCKPQGIVTLDSFRNERQETYQGNEIAVAAGNTWTAEGDYRNFLLSGQVLTQSGAEAALHFHTDGTSGYEVTFRNGAIDGTCKSGSLARVRNLYRSLAEDGKWFDFELAVRGKNISISINRTEVVCYTEPEQPFRTPEFSQRLLGHGAIALEGKKIRYCSAIYGSPGWKQMHAPPTTPCQPSMDRKMPSYACSRKTFL